MTVTPFDPPYPKTPCYIADLVSVYFIEPDLLPIVMQGGLVTKKVSDGLSVCPSVCLSNACIVTKRKKDLSRFLHHTKDHLAWFSEKKNGN